MEVNKKVFIDKSNPGVMRINEKCINCGTCLKTCEAKVGVVGLKKQSCLSCGQCILTCPMGALVPKYQYKRVLNLLHDTHYKVVVSVSPAVRVAIGDEFGFPKGEFLENKLVGILRKLGFDYVLDTCFSADVTILEEANELLERLKENKNLPLMTSCCPSWVKYVKETKKEYIRNLSTVKSPIGIQGALVKTYFAKYMNINPNRIIHVALTPCTSKKVEFSLPENQGVDYVITTSELSMMIRECGIDVNMINDAFFDHLLGESSGSGLIFGTSGGVCESAVRTLNYLLTGKILSKPLKILRDDKKVKVGSVKIDEYDIKVAVVYGIKNIYEIDIDDYAFIEVMNCESGCIGGGGQPLNAQKDNEEILKCRKESLYKEDSLKKKKVCVENKELQDLYDYFLKEDLNEKIFHTDHSVSEK